MPCFSFCLYGPYDPKYYTGLKENLTIINTHYPTWYTFVYLGEEVTEEYVQTLRGFKNIIIRRTGVTGVKNAVHRFFAIDDEGVDIMFVRDADSRVHWKDRWAIDKFMQSTNKKCFLIRDHKDHTSRMAAGMWGIRKGLLPKPIRTLFADWTPIHFGSGDPSNVEGFGIDQNFLDTTIYPLCDGFVLTVTSIYVRGLDNEMRITFPFKWDPSIYVGRVEQVPYVEPPRPSMFSGQEVNALEVRWIPSQSVEWNRASYARRFNKV